MCTTWTPSGAGAICKGGTIMSYTFMGYPRANGKYGARNLVAVIPSVICANDVGQAICRQV